MNEIGTFRHQKHQKISPISVFFCHHTTNLHLQFKVREASKELQKENSSFFLLLIYQDLSLDIQAHITDAKSAPLPPTCCCKCTASLLLQAGQKAENPCRAGPGGRGVILSQAGPAKQFCQECWPKSCRRRTLEQCELAASVQHSV